MTWLGENSTHQNGAVRAGTANSSAKPLLGFLVNLLTRRVVVTFKKERRQYRRYIFPQYNIAMRMNNKL